MSALDPLGFVASVLEARGGLVEPDPGGALAVLPSELARALGLPETARLALAPGEEAVPCGLGSALLDRLVAEVRAEVPLASVRLDEAAPRTSAARSLGERFVTRNAVTEVREVTTGDATYCIAWIAWSAQADDRHDGLVRLVARLDDGSEPAPGWSMEPDPLAPQRALGLREIAVPSSAASVAPWLTARAERAVASAIEPLRATLARRHARDHERIAGYYGALASESVQRRRKIDDAALSAKLAHLAEERDAKLRELTERFSLRVSLAPAALLFVEVPAAFVRLRVRRRKREGELVACLPAGASAFDAISCAACLGATSKPLVCDDELHVLCERCAPSAEGRPRCPRCARQ